MKVKYTFSILSLMFFMAACSLDGVDNYSPQIQMATYPRLQNGDSLNIYGTHSADVILMDTIRVGDTVSFVIFMQSFSNNLTDLYLLQSADSSATIILPARITLDSIFLPSSEYNNGKFSIRPIYNRIFFPFKYVATKSNMQTKLTMRVVSDAKFDNVSGSNSASFDLLTPIKPKLIFEANE